MTLGPELNRLHSELNWKPLSKHWARFEILLGLAESPPEDAADALAVALCHHHTQSTLNRMSGLQG